MLAAKLASVRILRPESSCRSGSALRAVSSAHSTRLRAKRSGLICAGTAHPARGTGNRDGAFQPRRHAFSGGCSVAAGSTAAYAPGLA